MSIKKSLLSLLMVVLVLSCKQDKLPDQNTGSVDLTADLSQYDNSNLGLYKGTFTTLDASERGTVEIKILLNVPSRAVITLSSGATIALQSTSVVSSADVTNLSFVIDPNTELADTGLGVTFDLSVNADGTNIAITNTSLGSRDSHIIAAKETSRVPVNAVPGTFNCTSCGTTNWTSGQTFNLLIIGDATMEAVIDTDFTVNDTMFTSSGGSGDNNQANDCTSNGAFMDCSISGFTDIGPNRMDWVGTHSYDPGITACSQYNGTWTYDSPVLGNLAGTFTSDPQCVPPVNDVCGGAIIVTPGTSLTLNASATTGIGNPATTCGTAPSTASGLWYVLTDPGTDDIINIDTEGSNYNTKVNVYTDGCGTLTCLTGNDDIDPGNLQSRVTFPSVGDGSTQYWILVTKSDNTAAGTQSVLNVGVVYTVSAAIETAALLLEPSSPDPIDGTAFVNFGQDPSISNADFTTVLNLNDIVLWKGTTSTSGHIILMNDIQPTPTTTFNFFSGSEALPNLPEGEYGLKVKGGNPGETMPYLIYFFLKVGGELLPQEYFTDPKIRIN